MYINKPPCTIIMRTAHVFYPYIAKSLNVKIMSNINSIQIINVPIKRYLNGSNYAENGKFLMVIMMIERSKDFFDAYSDNCDGIYAAGSSIEDVKADVEKAIRLIKENLPESQWPNEIKGEYDIEWKFDVASFLDYLNHRAVPRKKQAERIREGIHKFAHELLSITL